MHLQVRLQQRGYIKKQVGSRLRQKSYDIYHKKLWMDICMLDKEKFCTNKILKRLLELETSCPRLIRYIRYKKFRVGIYAYSRQAHIVKWKPQFVPFSIHISCKILCGLSFSICLLFILKSKTTYFFRGFALKFTMWNTVWYI